jgi:hypothetical protein
MKNKLSIKLPNYELQVWTHDGEYNMFFDTKEEANKEYDLAVLEFGKDSVTLHDYTKLTKGF